MPLFNAASETDGAENMPLLTSQLFQMQWIVNLHDVYYSRVEYSLE